MLEHDRHNGVLDNIPSSYTIYGAPGAGIVGYTVNGGTPTEREAANALLIAAAPDLLAFVAKVAEGYEHTDAPLGIEARALLAKATGGQP